jgi:hypothetical protein
MNSGKMQNHGEILKFRAAMVAWPFSGWIKHLSAWSTIGWSAIFNATNNVKCNAGNDFPLQIAVRPTPGPSNFQGFRQTTLWHPKR